ncbi:hypothetical protein BBU72A_S0003 (plasmid) [Borreliella burgdorferi 72a]|uniref:Uncharacterized protein n=1 Tax=Borreliella burgdorferi 118a TaxID=476210 RepID=A0A7U3YB16_BORBG|nr:hypothetical protein BBU72A_S0003 [Borreliella burgdorferi 72a]ACN92760.1 hypothetical protein BBU118A_S06 [Borreliella burgdorferi 118a]
MSNEAAIKNNINSIIQAICDDKGADLLKYSMENPRLKSIEYWVNLMKDYSKRKTIN